MEWPHLSSPWVDYTIAVPVHNFECWMEIILNPDSTGSVFQGDVSHRAERKKVGAKIPSLNFSQKPRSRLTLNPARKKIRQPEWGCMLDSWLLLRQCIIKGVVSMYLSYTNLPIRKRLIWIYLDALHDPKGWPSQAMPIHHDPSDHTSPMGNTGSGWTLFRSFLGIFWSLKCTCILLDSLKESDTLRWWVFSQRKGRENMFNVL